MKEKFFLGLGRLSRKIPHFPGKYRLGKFLRSVFFPNLEFKEAFVWIKMKDAYEMYISLKNNTDFIAFWCGLYDSKLIKKFTKVFQADWVILDIGANIGFYTVPFSIVNKGFVYSFEPVTANYNHLTKAVVKNSCKNVYSFKLGLGEKKETLGICMTEKGETGNAVISNETLQKERGFSPTEFIDIVKLDDFYDENNIKRCDFIKIDVEGAEIAFVRGAKGVIKKYRPIIYGEFNSYFIRKNQQSVKEIWDLFTEMEYFIFRQHFNKKNTSFYKVESYKDDLCDLLLIPKETDSSVINMLVK